MEARQEPRWNALVRLADQLDRLAQAVDAVLVFVVPALVLLCFALVMARYLLASGSIAAQEALQWLHSLVFLLGSAGALKAGRHVRVDVFSQRWSPRTQALVDLLGHAFLLLPFCAFMFWISLDYVAASWSLGEASRDPGGLPAIYLLKTLIPLTAALLAVQALAELARCVVRLRAEDGSA
ncbi:MAG: hypothetical protein KatS3mg126_0686 [Lysobacteraceae bacterium]|nr:MAG: hypothetical protein KatS3mg126_0686 [Xanthomonadaceae bacterium]